MIRVAAGILVRERHVLICRRRKGDPFPLKWEFPGGKLREGESPSEALARELEEELGIRVAPGNLRSLETIRHLYPSGPEVELHFFRVRAFEGEPANLTFGEIAWVPERDLGHYDFLEADRPLVARIAAGGVPSAD